MKVAAVKDPASAIAARPCCRTSQFGPAVQAISEDLGIKM